MQNIVAIVMAAGLSSRMGTFKQLLPYKDKKVISSIVEVLLLSQITNTYVVVGHNKELIQQELSDYNITIIFNPDYEQGMHTSVMCAVKSIPSDCDGFMMVLGDQPEISVKLVDELIKAKSNTDKGIIIPSFANRKGHPVIFDKKYIEQARNLDPNKGLKALVQNNKDDIDYLIVNDESVLFDIDTPSDYENLIKRTY